MEELKKIQSWEERVHLVVSKITLSSTNLWSKDELKIAANLFYRKLLIADCYKPTSKLICQNIVLMKASHSDVQLNVLGNDYGLSEVCYLNKVF